MKDRIDYMDYAKGFGMICIILGHNAIPLGLNNWIHSFHVPLFFIVSGYFVKDCSFLHFFKSSFDGLLKPLVVTHLLSFLVLGVIFYLGSGENPYYSDWIIGQLLGIHNYGAPVLWFIYALFCGRFILLLLIKYLSKYIILISLVLFVVSSKCTNILDYQSVPLYIIQGLCSVVFLSIGYKLNKYGILLQKQVPFSLIVASLFLLLFASRVFVSFAQMVFPLGIWNVITSSFISIILIFY